MECFCAQVTKVDTQLKRETLTLRTHSTYLKIGTFKMWTTPKDFLRVNVTTLWDNGLIYARLIEATVNFIRCISYTSFPKMQLVEFDLHDIDSCM